MLLLCLRKPNKPFKTTTKVLFQLRRSLCVSRRDENHTDGGLDTTYLSPNGYKYLALVPPQTACVTQL